MSLVDDPDTALALRACDGDELAFAALCRRHTGLLYGIGQEVTYMPGGSRDDVLQEARIGLLVACRAWCPSHRVPFAAFAKLAVRRHVLTALSAARRLKHGPLNDATGIDHMVTDDGGTLADVLPGPASLDPAEVLEVRVDLRRVIDALSSLRGIEQDVLPFLVSGEHGWMERASRALGVKPKAIDNATQRIRRKARAA